MPKKRSQASIEKEALVQAAVNSYYAGEHTSITKAARAFNAPLSTVKHRVKGRQTRSDGHEKQQALSKAEESELARWITQLTAIGYGPGFALVREMAEEIRRRRVREVNDESIERIYLRPLGKKWVKSFLNRHPDLLSTIAVGIDAVRIKDVTKDALMNWFNDIRRVFEENNIDITNVYNMDESGFSIGTINATHIIINKQLRMKYQAQPGRQEWVSVIECICADGTAIPPLVIFRGENLSSSWIPAHISGDWRFSCNSRGWTSNIHGLEWLRRCFEPATRDKAHGETRVLICDGHASHVTVEFMAHCRAHNIVLLILPPHSSHLTQPLDVAVFGPLKKHMAAESQGIIQTEVLRIQKAEWLTAYVRAREKAFSTSNILSAFSGAGINPFNPQKVLRRIRGIDVEIEDHQSPSSESESENPLSLDPSLIPSSPVDIATYQTARSTLNEYMQQNPAFPTPFKNFVDRYTKSFDRVWTRNSITETRYNNLKEVSTERKRRESGVRAVLKGHHIVTSDDVFEKVMEAELASRKRKGTKRRRVERRSSSQSIEEDIGPIDDSQPPVGKVEDCIVVQF
jgi:frataxin-like iron-binding protein CyaY